MEDAKARRERLKAMKAAAQAADGPSNGDAGTAADEQEAEKPVLKFRNYAVRDAQHIEHERVGARDAAWGSNGAGSLRMSLDAPPPPPPPPRLRPPPYPSWKCPPWTANQRMLTRRSC